MKLLIVTNNPNRASFKQRIEIHIASLENRGIACEVAVLPSGSLDRRKLLKLGSEFSAVFLHKKRLNWLDTYWLRGYAGKIIYDFDDAVMYNDRRPEQVSRKRLHDFERTVKLADAVIAGNRYLAEHAAKFNKAVEILPTGLSLDDYRVSAKRTESEEIRLVWIGSKSTLMYLKELKNVLEEIGSRFSDVVLRIICDDFFELDNMKVEKRQWTAETQFLDLTESDIGLAPLPDNRFTRGKCGFKILQYAAAGLPVIASPVGVSAEYVSDGITGLHASSALEWTEKLGRAIRDPQQRISMGLAARQRVEKFDVAAVGRQLYDIVDKCIHGAIREQPQAAANSIKERESD
jgi:glycosyltransferase involved in cell wall biosynthesis